ncbi:pentraxin fusion protein-like [Tachysurus fulvidraco]|uniref:pentraxin fusion protein-like n=1 Tax=Tachysurus fulvidraco TaxID=1234273 RepID=UPI001FEDCACB|nr:pentraxin fusion protein-like [Tachysurus fulvidraco]XP_047666998.1 pentraxin fusion protein-like [Tachysurus fulvidraco]XP_047666999.1 pentraxin fusion protein-like [Tachysurus fulvidraco]XP_047667000.1 pentraxin fusion protein-like [Tachysurus fulvidraco]
MNSGIIALLLLLSLALANCGNVLLFPQETDTAYVQLTPKKPLNLQAFTLCMRVASELNNKRETILFAYRTSQADELNVWQENGVYALYLRSSHECVTFKLPPLSVVPIHLCLTWESTTGVTVFWVNGQRTMLKIYRRGFSVSPGGAIIIGQDLDSLLGSFDKNQSFVGEITDVHMWDSFLGAGQIKQLYEDQCHAPRGNVLDWNSLEYKINGNVVQVSGPEA